MVTKYKPIYFLLVQSNAISLFNNNTTTIQTFYFQDRFYGKTNGISAASEISC